MAESWFLKAILSLFLVVPGWMGVQFFHKNFGVRSEVFVVWYFLALAGGIIFWLKSQGVGIWPSTVGCLGIIFVGLLFGNFAHVFLFRAVAEAPNPGMAVAISGASSAVVFLLSWYLGFLLPRYFSAIAFNPVHFLGILLVLSGIVLLGSQK